MKWARLHGGNGSIPYRFHICSWQPVNLLVNEYEAGGGDRILFVCELFFFSLLTYCVYVYACTCTHVCVCMCMCVCVDSMWCKQCVFVNFVTCFGHYVVFFFSLLLRFLRVAWEVVRLIKFCSVLQIAHVWQQVTYFRCNYQHKIICLTTINIRYCSRCTGSLLQMRSIITCVWSDNQSISTFIFESR